MLPANLADYTLAIVAALALVLAAALVVRVAVLLVQRRRLRKALVTCWQTYLEALSVSVERLRAMRDVLTPARAGSHPPPLAQICDRIHGALEHDLKAIEAQLDQLTSAPDALWYALPIRWLPVPHLSDEVHDLVALAQEGASLQRHDQAPDPSNQQPQAHDGAQATPSGRPDHAPPRTLPERPDTTSGTSAAREIERGQPDPDPDAPDDVRVASQELDEMERCSVGLRRRMAELGAANRRLADDLARFDSTHANAEQLRGAMRQIEDAWRDNQRELEGLEDMVGRIEDDLIRLRRENVRLDQLRRRIREKESVGKRQEAMIELLKSEAQALQRTISSQRVGAANPRTDAGSQSLNPIGSKNAAAHSSANQR